MIEWKETRRVYPGGTPLDAISFLRGRDTDINTLEGTLVTDYAKIYYSTYGRDYGMWNPDSVIEEYKRELSEALETVARLKGESSYGAIDDPDLRLVDIYERTGRYIDETFGRVLREIDALDLYITDASLEGLPEDYHLGIDILSYGLRYPIDLESLTVGNWRLKLEEAFKATAEEFLESLRDVSSCEKILEKCNEYFIYPGSPVVE